MKVLGLIQILWNFYLKRSEHLQGVLKPILHVYWRITVLLFPLFFGVVLKFKLRAMHLSHTSSPFLVLYFLQVGFVAFCLSNSQTMILLLGPPVYLRLQTYTTTPLFVCSYGVLITFCLGWPPIMIFPISASLSWDYKCESLHLWIFFFLNILRQVLVI
jgi:hypothetical protein